MKASEETNSKGNVSDEKDNIVVYEPSKETSKDTVTKACTQNTNLANKMKVDAEAHAQKAIADDGYWSVEQTFSRIIDFTNALTGGDPSKIEEMREAFKKDYKQAEKTWSDELPDISQITYNAVMEKFDRMAWGLINLLAFDVHEYIYYIPV